MSLTIDERLKIIALRQADYQHNLAEVTLEGLSRSQKSLPCRFFYDTTGSSLFERISRLPEYYLTRTEQSILERSSGDIARVCGGPISMVELGSGSSCKTRLLIEAAIRFQGSLEYTPIDISTEFLIQSARSLLTEYPELRITAVAAEYSDAIRALPHAELPRLFLFLGSNIGNFDRSEAIPFMAAIRSGMQPADRMLVGVDMVKERAILEAAYNDSEGVTAAFNKNLLIRINRELGGQFDLDSFAHQAPFIVDKSRIEMRLVSRRNQHVRVAALDRSFDFDEGEYIHTENSHKYTPESFAAICEDAGLKVENVWKDERSWFTVNLLGPV